MTTSETTIAALSTPPGQSGIAVVRMSGPEALAVLSRVFRSMGGSRHQGEWEHRRLYHGRIHRAGETIDEVVVAVMRAPESYTGEDVVEISGHGGLVVVNRVLETLYQAGARAAQPGEFTKRAFLNGKMDLIQAEAVADLIGARSDLQRRAAQRQLQGGLSARIDALAAEMLDWLGVIEANIDFIEEDIETVDFRAAAHALQRQREVIDELLESAALSRPFRDGFQVAIAGPVNAGKSSLFNRLAGERRAIVTDIPGTTRDVLRESAVIDGLLFVFHDTAGLRPRAGDRVEAIGIEVAAEAARAADLVLFVIDGSQTPDEHTERALGDMDPARNLVVCSKSDLPRARVVDSILEALGEATVLAVSAHTGEGIGALRDAMVAKLDGEAIARLASERFVLNTRLVALLKSAREGCAALRSGLEAKAPLEILAEQAREVLACYEEATGRRYHDGLLDVIFSRFCLGK